MVSGEATFFAPWERLGDEEIHAVAGRIARDPLVRALLEVVDGELIARHEDGLEVRFPAAGDAPRTGPREATAQFPSQPPRRPGER